MGWWDFRPGAVGGETLRPGRGVGLEARYQSLNLTVFPLACPGRGLQLEPPSRCFPTLSWLNPYVWRA